MGKKCIAMNISTIAYELFIEIWTVLNLTSFNYSKNFSKKMLKLLRMLVSVSCLPLFLYINLLAMLPLFPLYTKVFWFVYDT